MLPMPLVDRLGRWQQHGSLGWGRDGGVTGVNDVDDGDDDDSSWEAEMLGTSDTTRQPGFYFASKGKASFFEETGSILNLGMKVRRH